MNLLCRIFGHKCLLIQNRDDPTCGQYLCRRCGFIMGGVGKSIFIKNVADENGGGINLTFEADNKVTLECRGAGGFGFSGGGGSSRSSIGGGGYLGGVPEFEQWEKRDEL